jgi:hypothetical protein
MDGWGTPVFLAAPQRQGRRATPPPGQLPETEWMMKLYGKRLVTDDPELAATSKRKCAADRFWQSKENVRIFYCGSAQPPPWSTSQAQHSRLLALPTEIRCQILEELLGEHERVADFGKFAVKIAILFTCKQLYAEGRPIAVAGQTFKSNEIPEEHVLMHHYIGPTIRRQLIRRGK